MDNETRDKLTCRLNEIVTEMSAELDAAVASLLGDGPPSDEQLRQHRWDMLDLFIPIQSIGLAILSLAHSEEEMELAYKEIDTGVKVHQIMQAVEDAKIEVEVKQNANLN